MHICLVMVLDVQVQGLHVYRTTKLLDAKCMLLCLLLDDTPERRPGKLSNSSPGPAYECVG